MWRGNFTGKYLGASPNQYSIGENGPAGGIIFFLEEDGRHGFEAAPTDQGTSSLGQGCGSGTNMLLGLSSDIGTGSSNTQKILTNCSTAGTAAAIAKAYSLNGYQDWYLPSKDELNELYKNKDILGNFANEYYWSSSERSSFEGWLQNFTTGVQAYTYKSFNGINYPVRVIRDF